MKNNSVAYEVLLYTKPEPNSDWEECEPIDLFFFLERCNRM